MLDELLSQLEREGIDEAIAREFIRRHRRHSGEAPAERPQLEHVSRRFVELHALLGLGWCMRDWHIEKTVALAQTLASLRGVLDLTAWPFAAPVVGGDATIVSLTSGSPVILDIALPAFITAGGGAALAAFIALAEKAWGLTIRISARREEIEATKAEYEARRSSAEAEIIQNYAQSLRMLRP